MAKDLTWTITSITELDYDDVSETIKHIIPLINGEKLPHEFSKPDTETDADIKTAIKAVLTDKGYSWDTEDGV